MMLRETSDLIGKKIDATDGDIGSVVDFYFDDAEWGVRYMVVDTGGWLRGRQVLIAPEAVVAGEDVGDALPVNLTKKQIEDSPSIVTDEPVPRQQEASYRQYFGWPPYAAYTPGGMGGPIMPPVAVPPLEPRPDTVTEEEPSGDPHLRSIDVVNGSRIDARDGHIGHVSNFLIDEETWAVRYLVVDTRDWLPGKHVLVPPHAIDGIDWRRGEVHVALDREQIKRAPAYENPQQIDERYEAQVRSYYAAA
jgi:hypothetical protein